jgi:membrane protease YdiL (CAAX protease family)
MTPVVSVAANTLANGVLLFAIPFSIYILYHRLRHKRSFGEIAGRAGLRLGDPRFVGYAALAAALVVGFLIVRPPSIEPFVREGSAQKVFLGVGFGPSLLAMAFLYGGLQTGFCEEFLFRGLIAGSLSRRMPPLAANVLQAVIFLAPHLFILAVMPEMWPILPVVLVGALFAGWLRQRSGSIVGPWIIHAAANVTMAISVGTRSAT